MLFIVIVIVIVSPTCVGLDDDDGREGAVTLLVESSGLEVVFAGPEDGGPGLAGSPHPAVENSRDLLAGHRAQAGHNVAGEEIFGALSAI